MLVLFLLCMICFNFKRNYLLPLDGDLPAIVLPVPSYETVMSDPFGMNVLFHDSVYAAPNRYFMHAIMSAYFKTVPFWFQQFATPIDSIYFTAAFARTFTQFFLVFIIAMYATGKKNFLDLDFLLAAAICVPLFQTYGFYTWMAVLDQAVTYMFFYAFSMSLVLLYFLPFFNAAIGRTPYNFKNSLLAMLILLCVVNSFSGPLNAPVTILICSAIFINHFASNLKKFNTGPFISRLKNIFRNVPRRFMGVILLSLILGLYSFYIGRNNMENQWSTLTLNESYRRLLTGFWYHYTFKLAQPVLIGIVILNAILIYYLKPDAEAKKVIRLIRWFGIISLLYIFLLPLGGYRIYRSNIIRYDTIMPVTLGLIIFYAYSAVYVMNHLKTKYKLVLYSLLITGITVLYVHEDWGIRNKNACERSAFEDIAASRENIVLLKQDCQVMNWGKMRIPEHSKSKTDMLLYWNIISEPKLYYQD